MILCISFIFGCSEDKTVTNANSYYPGVIIEISNSAGEQYFDHNFLPLLGNLAKVNEDSNVEILILGKRLERGQKIAVDPVALLKYIHEDKEMQLIVVIPTNPKYQSIKISNLVDLSVTYGSIKRIIEHWYSSYSGIGSNRIVTWENKSMAINVLNDELQN